VPLYSYKCLDCEATFEVHLSYSEVDEAQPVCPHCGSTNCERLISKINVAVSHEGDSQKGKDEPFTLTREHVEAAIGLTKLMEGSTSAEHNHGGEHGEHHDHHHDHDHT